MKRLAGLTLLSLAAALPAMAATIIAPVNGSRIAEGTVHVIGHLDPGQEGAAILFDGKPAADVKRTGLSFSFAVTPAPGKHKAEVSGSGKDATVSFLYGGASSSSSYAYHQAVVDGNCGDCHRKGAAKGDAEKADACYRCHPVGKYVYWHGPVSAGACTFCHDPHGSVDPAMLKHEERRLCISCHDQPSSKKHIEGEKKECRSCHDPHGSNDNKFFVIKKK
jgi:predicted CXXCH cytochrome family protein